MTNGMKASLWWICNPANLAKFPAFVTQGSEHVSSGPEAEIQAKLIWSQKAELSAFPFFGQACPSAKGKMSHSLQTITEQYKELYLSSDAPETTSISLRTKLPRDTLKSNPSGLSVSIARKLSNALSAKPPQTPAAGARGATCDLLDAHFSALDVDVVSISFFRLRISWGDRSYTGLLSPPVPISVALC